MEKLEIEVSLQHMQALAAMQAIAMGFETLKRGAADAGAQVDAMVVSLNSVAAAAQTMNTATANTAANVAKVTAAVTALTSALPAAAAAARQNFGAIGTAATSAGQAIDDSFGAAMDKMLSRFNLMNAPMEFLDKINAQLRDFSQSNGTLADNRIGEDEQLKRLVGNLGLRGDDRGQSVARKLQQNLTGSAAVSGRTALSALNIANATGHDPRKGEGAEFARQVAYAMEQQDLSEDDALNLVRSLKGQGIDDVKGLKTAVAKMDSLFTASSATSRSAFVRGYVNSVMPEVPKGVDPDYAASVFSSFLDGKTSEQQAAQATKQSFYLAQAPTAKMRGYFAHRAAELGVTSVKPVTDADLERMVGSRGNKEAIELANERRSIGAEETAITDADKTFKLKGHNAQERQDHADRMKARREALEARKLAADEKLAKLREEETSRREQEAFESVGVQARLQRVVTPTVRGLKTDAERNRFIESIGGMPNRVDQVVMLGSDAQQQQLARAAAALRAAKAGDTDDANDVWERSDLGQDRRTTSEMERDKVNATDAGSMYARLLLRKADTRRLTRAANGDYRLDAQGSLADKLTSLAQNKDRQLAKEATFFLEQDIDGLAGGINAKVDPTEAKQFQKRAFDLQRQFQDQKVSIVDNATDTEQASNLFERAKEYGLLMDEIEQYRAQKRRAAKAVKAVAGISGPSPTTRPAGSSATPGEAIGTASGPTDDVAGDVHYHTHNYYQQQHHTYSPGNVFIGGDAGLRDMPGVLEYEFNR